MSSYTVTITDPAHVAGITAARAAYNAALSLAPAQGEEGEPSYVPAQALEDHPDFIATDGDYVQFVMANAAASYARQYA
jgi:hypothetical protein